MFWRGAWLGRARCSWADIGNEADAGATMQKPEYTDRVQNSFDHGKRAQ